MDFQNWVLSLKALNFPNNTRAYPCPLDNCQRAFVSPRTCDAHLNRHLRYEYSPCGTCGYTNPSRDSYDKHKCFAGIKTGGRRPASRGEKARKRIAEKKEKEQKQETVGKKWKNHPRRKRSQSGVSTQKSTRKRSR